VTDGILGRAPRGRVAILLTSITALIALGGLAAAGCGDDDDGEETTTESSSTDLTAVKDYLTEHTAQLTEQVAALRAAGESYYELAESVDFDYEQLMDRHGDEVARLLDESKQAFRKANPAYEEMEGIVAGVPRLAQYDVDIDAGSDASDPESAVSFSLELPDGETLKQPGNLFFVVETSLFGTNPDFLAKGVDQDVDGDGKVEFGEGIPDANVYVAAVREFEAQAQSLDADAQEFQPTPSDAFTALTIMTPTMSEYFEAWKNSRFIAGEDATELGFVAASRLSDIADILEGLVFTYDEIEPLVAEESPQQAEQTREQLTGLLAYVEDLRDQEASGHEYTAEQADTLGAEAQRRAEAIAGQVTQAAQRLGIELQEA
jgi:Imelysin